MDAFLVLWALEKGVSFSFPKLLVKCLNISWTTNIDYQVVNNNGLSLSNRCNPSSRKYLRLTNAGYFFLYLPANLSWL